MRNALAVLAFGAALAAPTAHAQENPDPWEGLNRDLYALHDAIDRAVLEPVARGYRAVTPTPVRDGVRNVLRNLRSPVILANDLLQGEGERAGVTLARFGVNSTLGILGVFDPASDLGLDRHEEDFGQTLAVWGVESGPYVFVPLMGPTTVRDSAGRIVDMAFDPFTWAGGDDVRDARAARGVVTAVSAREGVIDSVDAIRRDSVDPYVSIRSSYGLLRESAIQNGRTDVEDLPDFDDIPAMSEDDAAAEDIPQQPDAIEAPTEPPALAPAEATPSSKTQTGDVT